MIFTRSGFLSRSGVERSVVGAATGFKFMNTAQMCLTLFLTLGAAARPWLDLTAAAAYVGSSLGVLVTAFRARRLRRIPVVIDVAVAVAVLLAATLFQPSGAADSWTDWPLAVTFLAGAEASACLPPVAAVAATAALIAASGSWIIATSRPEVHHLVYTSVVAYAGFALVGCVFLYYLRRLAALADERAETIRMLDEERTRRVLHTPYRLLNDLACMLRDQGQREGDRPERQAQLAEAVASVREIESIVRGTDPASSNLAADLRRLQDQFVDLPLIMNVDEAGLDLPPQVVYRVREATRSALQNVRLHAGASEVVVFAATDIAGWTVSVCDDGRGFAAAARRGVGLNDVIIGALRDVGAQVTIESSPGGGAVIEMTGGYKWAMGLEPESSSSTTRKS
jgi:hypothetical protein